MTAGLRSYEFFLSLVTIILGAALLVFGALKSQPELIDVGKWLLMGGTGTYGISRGLAKLGSTQPPAAASAPPADDKAAADAVAAIK